MRSTIHVVSARDYWAFADGLRSSRRAWRERTHAKHLGDVDVEAAAAEVAAALGNGVRHRDELLEVCRAFEPSRPTMV